ncbi:MAG: type II and III secretion system protein family protein [Holosporaceae bacterium]|nr:type II and III secretion system protein family protein [Holosporaceae bacterium]
MKKISFIFAGFALLACLVCHKSFSSDERDKKNDKESEEAPKVSRIPAGSGGRELREIELNTVNFIKLGAKVGEIFIPNPAVADVEMLSDTSMYLTGLVPGVTSLLIHDKNGNVIANYEIRVTYPLKEIKKAVTEMHPDAHVEILSVDNSIVLRGKVPSPEAAASVLDIVGRFVKSEKIINKLSIETATQVMLKVKIAEVSRILSKKLGINWKALSHGQDVTGMSYGFISGDAASFPAFSTDASALKADFDAKSMAGKVDGGRWLVHGGGSNGLSALIEALASESFASVLAEPTLVALSGKTATFNAGGEESYTVRQTGSDSNTTEFKSWGTAIEFTPIVMAEDRINITVKPTVSTIGAKNADGVPSLTTKEASTTVELGSGQSLVIAGLLQTTKSSHSTEAPFLADLPLFGALFRNSSVDISEKELVIIITPYIVKPSSKQLKAPNDMVPRMYSPLESILTRKFHKNIKHVGSAGFSVK